MTSDPGATRRMMIGLLRAAMMAPSPLGAQPWRYRARLSGQIELYADHDRTRRHGDPSGRAVHIACGTALFNLRLASAVAGRRAVLRLLPDPADPRMLATIRLDGPHRPQRDEIELFAVMGRPCAGGTSGPERPVQPEMLATLAEAARLEGVRLAFPVREETGRPSSLVDSAERAGAGDARPAGPSLLGVLRTGADGRLDWLRAGQALQRVLLSAVIYGISASLASQPMETAGQPRAAGEQPQLILRLAHRPPAPALARRAVPAPRGYRDPSAGSGHRMRAAGSAAR